MSNVHDKPPINSNRFETVSASLIDFMESNYRQDPDWFVEPENSAVGLYPGLPTPFSPSDSRIVMRQRALSDELRSLTYGAHIPESLRQSGVIDDHFVDMIQMNFDSYNTILGMNNNGNYVRWLDEHGSDDLSPQLDYVMQRGILGLAGQSEIIGLLRDTDGFMSGELSKLYHPYQYRMRHLPALRAETHQAIIDNGGGVDEMSGFYGLKLTPYVVQSRRPATVEEEREIVELHIEQNAAEEALSLIAHESIAAHGTLEDYADAAPYVERIDQVAKRLRQLNEATYLHRVEGLMASIKKRIGIVPMNDAYHLNVTERQLFAVVITDLKQTEAIQDTMQHIHGRREPVDEQELFMYQWVQDEFLAGSQRIVPVSTTTYAYESPNP